MSSRRKPPVPLAVLAAAALAAVPARADVLFVSQFNDGKIVRVALPSGTQTDIVVGLSNPEDGACAADGRIYVSESLSGKITRFNQDGTGATNIIPAAGAVSGPEGLTFDEAGNLYFNTRDIGGSAQGAWSLAGGDPANPATQILAPFTTFGEGSEIVVSGPHKGALLVVDRGARRVLRSEPPGAAPVVTIPAGSFPPDVSLYGVASNGCGEIFVAFALNNAGILSDVYRFDPEGTFLEVYSTPGILSHANFLEFDSDGNLYVTDNFTDSLFKIAPDKTMTLLATIPGGPGGLTVCRDQPVPKCGLTCDAGGPYSAECAGTATCVTLDGSLSSDASGAPITHSWTSDCPGATFDDPLIVAPQLCVNTAGLGCRIACTATLTVANGSTSASCTAAVTIEDTQPPTATCELRPAQPPGSPASPESPVSPASPASPQPPMSPASPASPASAVSRAAVDVLCAGADQCDPSPVVSAKVILTRHVVENGNCTIQTEEVDVACGERIELVRLAPRSRRDRRGRRSRSDPTASARCPARRSGWRCRRPTPVASSRRSARTWRPRPADRCRCRRGSRSARARSCAGSGADPNRLRPAGMLTFSEIAHRHHAILSPLSPAKLDQVIDLLELAPGARVLDAGCGKAEMLLRVMQRWGAHGVGVDVSEAFLEQARARAAGRVPAASLNLRAKPIEGFAAAPGSFDCALCCGATHIFGGYRETLRALTVLVRPGGLLVVGEGYWRRPPDPAYLEVLGGTAGELTSHAGNVERAGEAGLVPLYATVASDDEWDHYEGLYARSIELHAAENPGDPEVPAMRERIRRWRNGYLRWGRDTLGFGLYLFRKP